MFLQSTLFGMCDPSVDDRFLEARRVDLDERSWIDFVPGWLSGSDALFDELLDRLDLHQRTNIPMYDSLVNEPRLTASWRTDDYPPGGPTPLLDEIRHLLIDRYDRPFDSIGFNLYRDGNDSVAWHGDRHRHHVVDPVVAIVSVGEPRPFKIRRRRELGGGASRSWDLGRGDLLVMGGSCQHDWEHGVPKLRRGIGPRLSITYRHDAVRGSMSANSTRSHSQKMGETAEIETTRPISGSTRAMSPSTKNSVGPIRSGSSGK